jgi:MFS family permease
VAASAGRFIQGAGGVFALVGAAYIATTNFPASRAATLIGATQMFGMAGGSAGQFLVGPLIARGVPWQAFWIGMGVIGLAMSVVLYALLPGKASATTPNAERRTPNGARQRAKPDGRMPKAASTSGVLHAFSTVFRNPQSILCGMIAGLLFIPTTIFDMVWGVRFLQDARGFEYADAVLRSSLVPFGWIIGCPLLGLVSDRLGRRKPVIVAGGLVLLACLGWILYGPPGLFPPYTLGLVAGIASGAAMLPYTVIKEANRPEMSGTATGVVNFLNFTFSALLGPVFGWILVRVSSGASSMTLTHYQTTFQPLIYGVAVAILLTFLLRETGPAAAGRAR